MCVCACGSSNHPPTPHTPTPPSSPFHSIPSFPLSLSSPLPLQYVVFIPPCAGWRDTRFLLFCPAAGYAPASLRASLTCSIHTPSSLCLPLRGLLASLLPWLLLLLLEQWSCLTLRLYADTALLRFWSLPCWIIATESARDSNRGQEGRERDREPVLFIQLLHSSVCLFLRFPGLLRSSAGNKQTAESSLKEFILVSLRFLPLFIPGTECRGG